MDECHKCRPGQGRYYPLNCCRLRQLDNEVNDLRRRGLMLNWRAKLPEIEYEDLLAAVREQKGLDAGVEIGA